MVLLSRDADNFDYPGGLICASEPGFILYSSHIVQVFYIHYNIIHNPDIKVTGCMSGGYSRQEGDIEVFIPLKF